MLRRTVCQPTSRGSSRSSSIRQNHGLFLVSPRARCSLSGPHPQRSLAYHNRYVTTTAATTTPTTATKPKPPPPKQSLTKMLTSDSICYKRGSSTPSPLRKEDKHSLAAAQRLFTRGSTSGSTSNGGVTTARFLYSASKLSEHPENPGVVPEILVIGASNAGKSTFLNALLGVTGVALVSRTPGSTTLQNVYGAGLPKGWDHRSLGAWTTKPEAGVYLVDSPGYGYGSAKDYHEALSAYLEQRSSCRGVVLLLPLNKKIRPIDTGVLDHLASMNKRTLILLTKADTAKPGWVERWPEMANFLRDSMNRIGSRQEKKLGSSASWKEGDAWNPDIYVVAAGAKGRTATSNAAGMGGARRAILQLAGYDLKGRVSEEPSVATYGGDIVPFEDLQYKGQ